MEDYSRLTKKELVEEIDFLNSCYRSAHKERMASFFFLNSLALGCYFVAETEIDSLCCDDDMKDSLRHICRILEAVTPQEGK